MRINKIAAVCALAFAGMTGSALAAMPADLDAAVAAGRVISISGASAVQKGFTGIIGKMFDGTPSYFAEKNANIDGTGYVGVAGTLKTGYGAWSGQTIVVLYRTAGGSVWGVNPVARNTPIPALKVSSACTGTAGTAADPYVCGTQLLEPDAGVSDVAPAMFQSPINTEGETAADALSADELALLTSTPIYGLGFGVAATENLATIKLNRAAISAIMTYNVGTWDQVDASESGDIVVCRRVPGSGTQAVYNWFFGNYPCDTESAYNAPADRDASGAWDSSTKTFTVNGNAGGLVVVENSGSGEVRKCLEAAYDASKSLLPGYTTYTTADRDGVKDAVTVQFKNGVAHKAIGTLSMDSLSNSGTKWKYRSLDGAGKVVYDATEPDGMDEVGTGKFPTIDNIVDGSWDLMGMISFNVPARTTGDKLTAINAFLAAAQDPAVLESVSSLKYVSAGVPGGNYTYTTGNVMRGSYLGGNQCAPYNRNN